jgi:peptidoglycan/xylan/chitin deacetylase (PgdA/CDA1 family)
MNYRLGLTFLLLTLLTACTSPAAMAGEGGTVVPVSLSLPTTTQPVVPTASPTLDPLPTRLPACLHRQAQAGLIIPSPSPTKTLPPTEEPVFLLATVYSSEPRVPAITYHQFAADHAEASTANKVRYADFRNQLQSLYDSGYSLISLQDWLAGNLAAPLGRRPLIFTMDDLFFNNQIRLTGEGEPSPETGIGLLWQFVQQHPDFGFHLSLFATLGDKLYANPDDPNWQLELARTIAWSVAHDALIYNHTYMHVRLNNTAPNDITWELTMNDQYLRQLLGMVDCQDLVDRLGNIVALPYGEWPTKELARKALLDYASPEGVPLQAIMEIDFIVRPKFILPPYSPDFDRLHLPRIVATQSTIDYLVEHREQFPAAQQCSLGPLTETTIQEEKAIITQIALAIRQDRCPEGIYSVRGMIFEAQAAGTTRLYP